MIPKARVYLILLSIFWSTVGGAEEAANPGNQQPRPAVERPTSLDTLIIRPSSPIIRGNDRIRLESGFSGVGNGGGGDIRDTQNMISTLNLDFDPESISFDPVLKANPKAFFRCPGDASTVVPDLPAAFKGLLRLEDDDGDPLPSTGLCDDKNLRLVYSRFVVDLWEIAADRQSEPHRFMKEARQLSGGKIRVRIHSQPRKIPLSRGFAYEPAWFTPSDQLIHIGPRAEGGTLADMLVKRHYRGYFFNELSHLWVFSLAKTYPAIDHWHDFSSAGKAPPWGTFNISWSKDPYAIQTPQTAAVFESFSNVMEKLGHPFATQHPFADDSSSLPLHFDSERKNFYFAYDRRFNLPLESLIQNEAYLTTVLYILIKRLHTTDDLARGYANEGYNHSPVVTRPSAKIILDLTDALRGLVKGNAFENDPRPLFFQWMRAFDRVSAAQGDPSKPGTRLVREFFFYDIGEDVDIRGWVNPPVHHENSTRIYLKDPRDARRFYTPVAAQDDKKFREKSFLNWAENTPDERLLKILDSRFSDFEKIYVSWKATLTRLGNSPARVVQKLQSLSQRNRLGDLTLAMDSGMAGIRSCGSLESKHALLEDIANGNDLLPSMKEMTEVRRRFLFYKKELPGLRGEELREMKKKAISFLFAGTDLMIEDESCAAENVAIAISTLK